jgi:hypothetical protein
MPFLIVLLNKLMHLQDIRRRLASDFPQPISQKAATRAWLGSLAKDYPLALTLTLKQQIVEITPLGRRQHANTRQDAERIAKRFMQKLNRQAFGKRAAEQYGRSLKYIVVLEGDRSKKNLHLHFSIGDLPSTIRLNQFDSLVRAAKSLVEHVDEQHKVDLADSGWMEYICKELGRRDTDNVLWSIC